MIRKSAFRNKRPVRDFPYFFAAERFMNILFLPTLSVLLFWCAACAALPFSFCATGGLPGSESVPCLTKVQIRYQDCVS